MSEPALSEPAFSDSLSESESALDSSFSDSEAALDSAFSDSESAFDFTFSDSESASFFEEALEALLDADEADFLRARFFFLSSAEDAFDSALEDAFDLADPSELESLFDIWPYAPRPPA